MSGPDFLALGMGFGAAFGSSSYDSDLDANGDGVIRGLVSRSSARATANRPVLRASPPPAVFPAFDVRAGAPGRNGTAALHPAGFPGRT